MLINVLIFTEEYNSHTYGGYIEVLISNIAICISNDMGVNGK